MKDKSSSYVTIVKDAFKNFSAHDATTGAAALSFYSALSLAPLVLLFIAVAGLLGDGAQKTIVEQFSGLVGPQGGKAIEMIVASADKDKESGWVSTIISLIVLAFSAGAVFAQLQSELNKIFDVHVKEGLGVWGWLRKGIFSMGILFSIGLGELLSTHRVFWCRAHTFDSRKKRCRCQAR